MTREFNKIAELVEDLKDRGDHKHAEEVIKLVRQHTNMRQYLHALREAFKNNDMSWLDKLMLNHVGDMDPDLANCVYLASRVVSTRASASS